MIKPQLNVTSVQKGNRTIEEKVSEMIYFKRLEKLNNDFKMYITMGQFSNEKLLKGKYCREGFLFGWQDER